MYWEIDTALDDKEEKWYFSIVDVLAVLTDSANATDGKMRQTDVADQAQLFRLIQSIPSPKAEPFKVWTAQAAKGISKTALLTST